MFGHNDNRGSQRTINPAAPPDGILTSDDNKASAVLVGDMTTAYPPADLPTPMPTSAPAPPAAAADDALSSFNTEAPVAPSTPVPTIPDVPDAPSVPVLDTPHPDELLDIKQQALQHLSPLVDHLEQDPSDRFRTTMMMIQASDNASLIKAAYDAALQISDDKQRAQALLDLINEINYFTHNKPTSPSAQA